MRHAQKERKTESVAKQTSAKPSLCGGGAALQGQASAVAAHVDVEIVVKELEVEGCLKK